MQNNFALFLEEPKPIPIASPPVAVANTNKSTPHHDTTPKIVATKIPTGKICLNDLGIPPFFYVHNLVV